MPTNEEGEFELILGNKQLLSVSFIFLVLLALFFTMGYIVGRNTGPPAEMAANGAAQSPIVVDAPEASSSEGRPSPVASTSPSAPVTPPPTTPAPTTPAPTTPAPTTPAPTKSAAAVPPPKPPAPVPAASTGSLPSGAYWQVVATTRPEAELLTDVLSKKGFPAKLQPVPDSELMRVLVGPLSGDAAVSKTLEDLQAAGFKPFRRTL